ncbi:hypothetical protein HDU86_005540 [Geranomyces michiganensis]|nr:hypothetical protein HDU86_005540 [Geranomyces michiganensis]
MHSAPPSTARAAVPAQVAAAAPPAVSAAAPALAPSFSSAVCSLFDLHNKELNDVRLKLMTRLAESEAQSTRLEAMHAQAVEHDAQRDAAHQLALAEATRRAKVAETRAAKYFALYHKQAAELKKLRHQTGSKEAAAGSVEIDDNDELLKENNRLNLLLATERESHAAERASLTQALAAEQERRRRQSDEYEQQTARLLDYKKRIGEAKLSKHLGGLQNASRNADTSAQSYKPLHPSSSGEAPVVAPVLVEHVVQLAELPPRRSAPKSSKSAVRKMTFEEADSSCEAHPPLKRHCSESPSRPPLRERALENGRSSFPLQSSQSLTPGTPTPVPATDRAARPLTDITAAELSADNSQHQQQQQQQQRRHKVASPEPKPPTFSPTMQPTLTLDDDVALNDFERGFGFKDPADAGPSVMMSPPFGGFTHLDAEDSDEDIDLLPVDCAPKLDFFATPPFRGSAAVLTKQPQQPGSAALPQQSVKKAKNLLAMSSPPSQGDLNDDDDNGGAEQDDSIPPLPPPRTDIVFGQRENLAAAADSTVRTDEKNNDKHDFLTPRPRATSGERKRHKGSTTAPASTAAVMGTKTTGGGHSGTPRVSSTSAGKKPPNTAPPKTSSTTTKSAAPVSKRRPPLEVVNLDSSDLEPLDDDDDDQDDDDDSIENTKQQQSKSKPSKSKPIPKPAPFSAFAAAEARKSNAPQHQYHEVVRNKDARRMMHAVDCPCCRDVLGYGLPDDARGGFAC